MGKFKSTSLILLALTVGFPALGAVNYGDALLEKGAMTVLRDGKALMFTAQDQQAAIEILEQDVIRVGRDSRVRLTTVDHAILTLGSNAILHVNALQLDADIGLLRLLYGRLKVALSVLWDGQLFETKSATVVVGVKGTEFLLVQAATGTTVLVVTENIVEGQGLTGLPVQVSAGRTSVTTGRDAGPATETTETYRNIAETDQLDADDVESAAASNVPDEAGLVDSGATTAEDLEEAKKEEAPSAIEGFETATETGDELLPLFEPEIPSIHVDPESIPRPQFPVNIDIVR